jgi:hypothetical protein
MLAAVFSRILIFSGVSVLFTGFYASTMGRDTKGVGPKSRIWESVRHGFSRKLSRIDERFGPREITEEEYVKEVEKNPEEVEEELRQQGFTRNPLSRLKTLEGEVEYGSWVKRKSPLDRRQLHVMLFETREGTEVYAHEEYSSMHPFYAYEHFNGVDQRREEGSDEAEEKLDI